jgi:predicted CoA-binding protein
MTSKQVVKDFLAQRSLALVGLSRSGKAFSNMVYKELKAKGYKLFPVNPNAESIEGEKCYPSVAALPEKVGGALFFTPSTETEKAVREAVAAGVTHVWLQQGAESSGALKVCQENNLSFVAGECIMMFAEPVAFLHKPHRWLWGLMGKLPR